jgi:predicted ATP pyrophosphatase (TIGR00289 family)
MKVAVLYSGGKDSTSAVHWCLEQGYEVKYLVTMISEKEDSWMFHTPNIEFTEISAEAIEIPLITKETSGIKEKELDDLKDVLKILDVEAVVCGGILSEYQKTRFEKVSKELDLKLLSPFWHVNPEKFLKEMLRFRFEVLIIGVYAEGFDESWLGKKIDKKTLKELKKLNEKFSISLVGEGGEYETFVIDGPIFKKRIEILESKKCWDNKTQSGYLRILKARLTDK